MPPLGVLVAVKKKEKKNIKLFFFFSEKIYGDGVYCRGLWSQTVSL